MKKIIYLILLVFASAIFVISCTDARVASRNLAKDAEQFKIYRRVVFYNGITDSYILSVQGYCSIEDVRGQLEVTVKTPDGTFLKHHLGLSDNVTYFSEQLDPKTVSTKQYKVIFKPSAIVPDIDIE